MSDILGKNKFFLTNRKEVSIVEKIFEERRWKEKNCCLLCLVVKNNKEGGKICQPKDKNTCGIKK